MEFENIDIPFVGGLETKLDGVIADKSRVLALSNATFNKAGTLTRREAAALLTGTGTSAIPKVIEVATLGSELVAVDDTAGNLFAYPPTSTVPIARGQPSRFSLAVDQITRNTGKQINCSTAYSNGFSAYVWTDLAAGASSQNIKYAVVDEASGTTIGSGTLSSSATTGLATPKVVAGGTNGDHFIFIWEDFNALEVYCASVVTATGVVSTAQTRIATDLSTNRSVFDACPLVSGQALVVYGSSLALTAVGALTINSSCAIVAVEINALTLAAFAGGTKLISALGVVPFSSTQALVFACDINTAGQVVHSVVTYSAGVLTATGSVGTPTGGSTSTGITAVFDSSASLIRGVYAGGVASAQPFCIFTANTANTMTFTSTILRQITHGNLSGPFLAGTAFMCGSGANAKPYVPICMNSVEQSGVYIIDFSGNVCGVIAYGNYSFANQANGYVPQTAVVSPTVTSIPLVEFGTISFTDGANTTQTGVSRARLTLGRTTTANNSTPMWHAQIGKSLFFSGALMTAYDGFQVTEAGFLYYPEGTSGVGSGGGGITGTFQICALYEWTDNHGQVYQSAPSTPVTVTLTANTTLTYTAPTLQLGARAPAATVVFYRTVNAGSTFYRENSPLAPKSAFAAASTVTLAVTTPTSSASADPIIANQVLYTQGGALPNDLPPACNAIAVHQERLVYSNAEDPQSWLFSQEASPGVGLQFSGSLTGGRTPQAAGRINALAVLDDKLVIATPTKKFWVTGSGPDETGANGTYSSPQLLPSDVGVIDQRSVALLPDVSIDSGPTQIAKPGGLIYQTLHGMYLLDRSLVDRFVGFGVDGLLTGNTVSSAVVLENKAQARFTLGGQTVLVYDYLWGQWSSFVYPSSPSTVAPNSACNWNGLYTFGVGAGAQGVWQEVPGSYLDQGSQAIVASLTTAWIKVGSIQGYQRVQNALVLGSYGEASSLTVTSAVNYDTTTAGTFTADTSTLKTADALRWQARWQLTAQKCQAVQFTITDTPTTGGLSGVGLSGITLELGVKRGPMKLPAAQSF